MALLGPLGVLWLAGGIVDSIIGGIGWVTNPIYTWVRNLVNGVVGWVSDWVNHVVDWASDTFDWIRGVFDALWDFGNSIVTWAWGITTDLYDRLVAWIGNRIADVRNWVSDWVNHVIDWAAGLIDELGRWAEGTFNWLRDHVWDPLWDRVEGLWSWVADTVLPWVSRELAGLTQWARDMFDWVVDHVFDLLRPWLDWAGSLLDLVSKCWGWLVWIAMHPYDWFVQLWHQIGDLSPETVATMVERSLDRDQDWLERAVASWFD